MALAAEPFPEVLIGVDALTAQPFVVAAADVSHELTIGVHAAAELVGRVGLRHSNTPFRSLFGRPVHVDGAVAAHRACPFVVPDESARCRGWLEYIHEH